ncbi:uncharacterized protein PITG_14653 [Phytophthora infestans T30-4]|uniref:Uncharacterized protein n=1 Tax=Phytophthora infestans (strain T30-4) TaxID=403677 RepID=D0NQS2_PHYIT|nr:uncharacterized protein PITG_14650 [Phytophthora infestans T30-4]XP_002898546.1 uncharacterized protein PITG_14653 [Phytophthora infestans T30-4]EEY63020.1 conserved hypothetical protein [Phytophthora infestans T30-4]EEY63023.1 conserved hypothetical protein [Phytophthora infestans T30-4]|eukprot:XP_002898543.1 conserved hypothetical protein [Phytophthora infestans T30-4]
MIIRRESTRTTLAPHSSKQNIRIRPHAVKACAQHAVERDSPESSAPRTEPADGRNVKNDAFGSVSLDLSRRDSRFRGTSDTEETTAPAVVIAIKHAIHGELARRGIAICVANASPATSSSLRARAQ